MGKFSPSNTSTPDLEVDGGTLSVDETNDRIGIGVTDPDHKLEVAGPIHISGETTTPSQPAGGDGGVLYVKADGKIYWRSNEVSETDLTAAAGMTNFVAEDGDGTEVTVSNAKQIKFVDGAGMQINFTDADSGADGDEYDLSFNFTMAAYSGVSAAHGDSFMTLDSGGSTHQRATTTSVATLFAGAGLTATNSVIAVDADQSSQITSVGTLGSLTVTNGIEIAANEADTITATGGSTVTAGTVTQSARKGVITVDLATNSCNIANMATYTVTLTNGACDVDSVIAVTTTAQSAAVSHTLSDSGCKLAITNSTGGAITSNFTLNYVIL